MAGTHKICSIHGNNNTWPNNYDDKDHRDDIDNDDAGM